MQARKLDPANPLTWEFSGFSQNGEDGVIDTLRRRILKPNFYFIEIGSSNGIENNSAWLAYAEKCNGLMIEGNRKVAFRANQLVTSFCQGVECLGMFVDQENVMDLYKKALHKDPDVFSLDIDGNDYYVARALLNAGLRPKIFVVEYNSVFGPDKNATVPYRKDFDFRQAHSSQLYYGVSITAWRKFFSENGYHFITVERNGVNAFFVDAAHFSPDFINSVRGLAFAENFYQLNKFRCPGIEQFALIQDQPFVEV